MQPILAVAPGSHTHGLCRNEVRTVSAVLFQDCYSLAWLTRALVAAQAQDCVDVRAIRTHHVVVLYCYRGLV